MPEATFEVKFVAPQLVPEGLPLRAVSEALSAVQDLASGRDPFETPQVPPDKSIGLLKVLRGSAVYRCVSRAPKEALANLEAVGELLSSSDGDEVIRDGRLVSSLRPLQSLSEVAKSVGCRVEVNASGHRRAPLFVIEEDAFEKISRRVFLKGDTTIIGNVERVGGATGMRCLLRVPGRRRILYCDVATKELVRRLGQHLYEEIAASGTAVWIHYTWRVYQFEIRDFTQPRLGNPAKAMESLRDAGLDAWDRIEDPEAYLREFKQ